MHPLPKNKFFRHPGAYCMLPLAGPPLALAPLVLASLAGPLSSGPLALVPALVPFGPTFGPLDPSHPIPARPTLTKP